LLDISSENGEIQQCCLQTAATLLTRHDPAMQYSAEVGVNSYVRIMLSFLHKEVWSCVCCRNSKSKHVYLPCCVPSGS